MALTAPSDSLVPQQTLTLSASAKDTAGDAISDAIIAWSVTPTSVAAVSATGVLTGVAPGTATVSALSGGKSATAAITVLYGGMVGPAGATLNGPGGAATLVIPAGALTTPTPISIEPMSAPPLSPELVIGSAMNFGPTGTQFDAPVTIQLHYMPSQVQLGTEPSELQLYLLTGNAWTVVPGSTVDTTTHTITGTTTHFSGYTGCNADCITSLSYVNIGFANDGATIVQGASYSSDEGSVYSKGYAGPVTVVLSDFPPGVTAAVTTQPVTGGISPFSYTVHVAATVAPGSYQFHGTAVPAGGSGAIGTTATFNLYVVAPGFGITPSHTSISVVQGSSAPVTLTLSRQYYTGSIAFSAENLPAGVTAGFSPSSTTDSVSVLTLTATAGAVPGNYTITIRGKASGLSDQVLSLPLTIESASGFVLAATPAFANVSPGGSGSTSVEVTRFQAFSGGITYSESGLPAGLTAAFSTTSVPDSMRAIFTASAGLAAGSYPITVIGTSGNKSSSVVISVTVAAPGTVTVHLDYSRCDVSVRPVWVAYQDGSGAFTAVTGTGGVFAFNLTQGKGAAAIVTPYYNSSSYQTAILFGTPSELPLMVTCGYAPSSAVGQTLNFTLAGMLSGDVANVSTPMSTFQVPSAVPSGSVTGPSSGTVDVTVFRYNSGNPALDVRGLIRRGVNLPTGGDLGTLDLNGPESFVPLHGNLTVQGSNDEQINWSEFYVTQPQSCPASNLFMNAQSASGTAVYGFPASVQEAGDLHVFTVFTATRATTQYMHAFGSPTVVLGTPLSAPPITALPGAYKRPQVTVYLSSDYQFASYSWGATGNGLTMTGSTGYYGGGTLTLAMPDLTTLPGYNVDGWAPPTGSGTYGLTALSSLGPTCVDGGSSRQAHVGGTN